MASQETGLDAHTHPPSREGRVLTGIAGPDLAQGQVFVFMKRLIIIALFGFVAGCSRHEAAKIPVHSVCDDAGRTVAFTQAPRRIVALAPSAAELVYALGCGDRVVGVSAWCNYPPQAKQQPVVGDAASVNAEKLLALKPDFVIMVGGRQSPALATLEALGITAIVLDPKSPDDVIGDLKLLGSALQCSNAADSLASSLSAVIDSFERELALVPEAKRPKAFAEIGINPVYTASSNSYLGQLIALAGGKNIAGTLLQDYAVINAEAVIAANPDVILVLHPMARGADVAHRIGWANISAVRSGRVYDNIDLDVVLRPGPRFVSGLRELHRVLYDQKP
jgi:iron complex transport system substrate-binding protein